MLMPPDWTVVLAWLFAGVGIIYYVRSRRRRALRAMFGWLIIPAFTTVILYAWFWLGNISLAERSTPARLQFIITGIFQGLIMFIVGYLSSHDRSH